MTKRLGVEAYFACGRSGRRGKQRLDFLPDDLEGTVVFEEGLINLCEPLEDISVGQDVLAHLHEGSDDKDAHADGLGTVQDGGRHDGTVLGEDVGEIFDVLSALQGRSLRP